MNKLNYCWRLFATAFCFTVFGLGGILIPLIVVPILYLLPGGEKKRLQRGKLFIHLCFRSFIWLMKTLGIYSYETHGLEKLQQAQLILANHPTLIDVVFLISFVPNANCVVKSALVKNPFTRGPLKAAGYIVNDESSSDVIDAAEDAFANGDCLIIFPEGTRSIPDQSLKLKRGAANVAIRAKAMVTPVLIHCEPVMLMKGNPWYKIPSQKPHFRIRVEQVMQTSQYLEHDKPSVAARNLTADLSQFFNQEMGFSEQAAR
jgi:1-acyl-sn-glycerol-3-phosphate acyltransferase